MSKSKKAGEPDTEPDGTEPVQAEPVKELDALTRASRERIGKAIEGRALSGFTGIAAGDVVKLAESIPAEQQSDTVKSLVQGAKGHKPDAEIFQKTESLAHLLEVAKG